MKSADLASMITTECRNHWVAIRRNKSIAVVPLLVLVALCSVSVSLLLVNDEAKIKLLRNEAGLIAEETGILISDQLDQAILPVFSLAQFVTELDDLRELPELIEPTPMRTDKLRDDVYPTHRNVTGICDNPPLVEHYNSIASTIKKNAGMERVLVNLQLAPQAVVCLAYPLNNTEDFDDGIYFDSSGAIGHDLLNDPARKYIAEATVPADDLVIAGPLSLVQCQDCHPTVEKAFIARLPIQSPNNQTNIVVNDQPYNVWGFAVALINWVEVLQQSKVYERFDANQGMEFRLTRTDLKYDAEQDQYNEKVVVLAESAGMKTLEDQRSSSSCRDTVSVELDTTNNKWVMTVSYSIQEVTGRQAWAMSLAILVALGVSLLVYYVLYQKDALMLAAQKTAQHERELSEFIAHEVRNPLSAALSASVFVGTAVQGELSDDAMDSLREDSNIIHSSLRFINDLLRSMLDINRATREQMVLDMDHVDIHCDIFEPVGSMIYARDSNFVIEIDCPPGLVVKSDKLRLQQVILNLARNSAKFVIDGFLRLRAEVIENSVHLYVEDSGPGIPEEKRDSLFNKYQKSLDSCAQGTGVGLSLVEKLVNLMEATIWLDQAYVSGYREDCPGARLVIDLKQAPLDPNHEIDDASETDVMDLSTFEGGRGEVELAKLLPTTQDKLSKIPKCLDVLLVDDDRKLRKLFRRCLGLVRPEWNIREVASGEACLQLCEKETFDLIFMDQYMTSVEQSLKGTETVRTLRSRGVTSLIVGLSANNLHKVFVEAGAETFWTKPFPTDPKDLTDFLSDLFVKKNQCPSTCDLTDLTSQNSSRNLSLLDIDVGMNEVKEDDTDETLPKSLSVLFVDDDRVLRRLAMRGIKRILPDCNIREAVSADNAIQLCESNQFDVIFMDQHMTSTATETMTGTETVRAMRNNGIQSIICGLSANQEHEAFLEAGATGFWLKPFPCKESELRPALQLLLEKGGLCSQEDIDHCY